MFLGEMPLASQNGDKINFYEGGVGCLGGRSIWRDGMPLSLRGTQHGHAQGARRQMSNTKKNKKNKVTTKEKEKYMRQHGLQLAPEGGIPLTCTRFSLMRRWKTRVWKQRWVTCECVLYCLCVVDFYAASAPWRCLSVAKGPQPWPRISRWAVSTQHFPSPLVN